MTTTYIKHWLVEEVIKDHMIVQINYFRIISIIKNKGKHIA
jgi:hypothetical protein